MYLLRWKHACQHIPECACPFFNLAIRKQERLIGKHIKINTPIETVYAVQAAPPVTQRFIPPAMVCDHDPFGLVR